MASDDGNTMLSRSGNSGQSKLTGRLDIPLSEELLEAIVALATLAGIPKAEYARWVLETHAFGSLNMARRVNRTLGIGQSDESGMGGRG